MSSKKVFLLVIAISIIGACNYRKNATDSSDTGHVSLNQLCEKYHTDKCPGGHNFLGVYELFFNPFRNVAKKVAEIGIAQGASLNLWKDYFPQATVYGIDIFDNSNLNTERIKTFIGDQSKRESLQGFITKYGSDFDFILDDGGHSMEQQQVSFGFLFKHVKHSGYYIIEDLQTSIYKGEYGSKPEFGTKPDESNATLTMIRTFINTRFINSVYLTNEETEYLNKTIEYCSVFSTNKNSITCIIKKKDS
jgi:hypothetical protein